MRRKKPARAPKPRNICFKSKTDFIDKIITIVSFKNGLFECMAYGVNFSIKETRCAYVLAFKNVKERFVRLYDLASYLYDKLFTIQSALSDDCVEL